MAEQFISRGFKGRARDTDRVLKERIPPGQYETKEFPVLSAGALAFSNVSEALSATTGMRGASRSSTYVLILWSGIALGTAAMTALAFYLLSDLGPDLTTIFKALGAGAIIAMAAETMVPEAFHNGPPLFRPSRRLGLRSPHPAQRSR